MAKDNYSFKKKQKELARKKKQEEKLKSKLAKRNSQAQPGSEPASGQDNPIA